MGRRRKEDDEFLTKLGYFITAVVMIPAVIVVMFIVGAIFGWIEP